MRRTLVVTADPAWPPVSGADLRNWQNASALAGLGPVTLASIGPLQVVAPTPLSRVTVVALTQAGEKRGPVLPRNATPVEATIPEVALVRLRSIVSESRHDTVLIEGIGLFPFIAALRTTASMLVLDMHNVESDLAQQKSASSLVRQAVERLSGQVQRIRWLELAAARMVDRLWVCSRQDEARLRDGVGPSVPVWIVPNGVPRADTLPPFLAAMPPSGGEGPIMLFIGHLNYDPNVVAVRRLVKAILPDIRRDLPGARLVVAGRRPSARLARLAASNDFDLVADPADADRLLANAHVAVVPLTTGGGTRLKVLEAMSRGVPVVATPLAIEGLDLVDRVHALLADTDRGLADCVRQLWADPMLAERLRTAAHRFVMDRFGPLATQRAVREAIG